MTGKRRIGTLAETSLHESLKTAQPGDLLEHDLDGYVIDIVRPMPEGRYQCMEIQTRNLGKLKPKLVALLDKYPVYMVYPVAQEHHIIRIDSRDR